LPGISNRKKEHLEEAIRDGSQTDLSAGWEDVHLLAVSLPELATEDIDLSASLGDHGLEAPFVIASMTGGHEEAVEINRRLAHAAQELGLAIGSGSQRAALRDPALRHTYTVIRETAADAVVLANIGVCQLVEQGDDPALTRADVEAAVEMLEAQFLIIHLNLIEELIQPEGDSNMVGLIPAIADVASWSPVPVVVKETGAGMTRETARALHEIGVSIIDVGGAGGTSFARIEGARAAQAGDHLRSRLGATFGEWGIPTAVSILETRDAGLPVIATGGVRNGLEVAKALALGAAVVGVGRPVLAAALQGSRELFDELGSFIAELRLGMMLTGSADVDRLREPPPVLTGRVRDWAVQRGLLR
jgi:isopentenyl-diphosphate delta-isomerase